MIDQSDDAIEQGLRLAAQTWGGKMQLTGSNNFLRRAITIAAQKNMQIEFADPVHKTLLQNLKHEIAIGKLEIANHAEREKQRMQDEAEANRKNAKGVPTPGKPLKDKNKEGTGGSSKPGDSSSPAKQPRNQPSQHQVVYPPEPEPDEGDRVK